MITFLSGLLFAVDVACALLLIGIILIQQSKSGGGLGAISGGMTESVFGAAAGNVITKTTVILASVFLVSTLALAVLSKYQPATETFGDRLKQKEQTEGAGSILDEMKSDAEQAVEDEAASDAATAGESLQDAEELLEGGDDAEDDVGDDESIQ